MKRNVLLAFLLLTLCAAGIGLRTALRARRTLASSSSFSTQKEWNVGAAASYLESREVWWQKWPTAQMDRGTICISCHTVVPYALARPLLRQELGEKEMTVAEKTMLASVEKRVTDWANVAPFYSDAAGPGKAAQSHATEAVLNAVILANYDAALGHFRPVTRTAFDEAWALQETSGENAGGWKWQVFNLAPWESKESAYQGAALLAVTLGNTPSRYANDLGTRENLDRLQEYLRRQYASQPLMSQLYILWASARMPGLLIGAYRTKLIAQVKNLQQSDGGWALFSLDEQGGLKRIALEDWKRLNHNVESDGCATGLVVLALEEAGIGPQDDTVKRGLAWLEQHQQRDGSWWASSLNGTFDPTSDIGRFMSDAATGYAVLALETAKKDHLIAHGPQSGASGEIGAVNNPTH